MTTNWTRTGGFLERSRASAREFFPRAVALFLLLAALKVALMAGLHGDIYHTHERLHTESQNWFDCFNYGLSIVLIAATLVMLGRSAKTWPRGETRKLSAGLAVAGLVFAFFGLSQGGWNYVYPVINGTLSVWDIRHYLAWNFIFGQPFIAAYLGVFAVAFWILVRTRREHLLFHLLAAMSLVYWTLNFRELIELRGQLVVVNCVGLLAIFATLRANRPLPWPVHLIPALLTLPLWFLFSRHSEDFARPNDCFLIVLGVSLIFYFAAYFLARRGKSFCELSHLLPFYFLAFLLFSTRLAPLSGNYGRLIVCGLTVSRYFVEELLFVALLLGAAVTLHRLLPRAVKLFFDVVALLLLTVAVADLRITTQMDARLDWNAFVVGNDFKMLWRTIEPFVGWMAVGLAFIVAVYLGLTKLAGKLSRRAPALPAISTSAFLAAPILLALLTFVIPKMIKTDKAEHSALFNIAATSPFARGLAVARLSPAEFQQTARELGFSHGSSAGVRQIVSDGKKVNVLVIVLESSYNKYLSLFGAEDETQPLLKKYRDRMEIFPNFFSNFPNSFHARFTVLSGLLAPKEYVSYLNPRIGVPTLYEILHDQGYATAMFDSCSRNYVREVDFMGHRKLDEFYDCDNMPGREKFKPVSWGVLETATMEAMRAQFKRYSESGTNFCVSYFPVAPHMPFDSPSKEFDKFDNGAGIMDGDYSGRYKNQLLYMDWILASIIGSLEQFGLLDSTVVIITNDHGEMVGDGDKKLGHGWRVTPELCNTPLIIMDPRHPGYRVNYTVGSQVDVLPTVLDVMNIPKPAGELYEGVSLHDESAATNRTIWFNSYRQRAFIAGNKYYLEDAEPGQNPKDARVHVYEMANDGVKTLFRETNERADISSRLDKYERFQKSLIVHYDYYRKVSVQGSSGAQIQVSR